MKLPMFPVALLALVACGEPLASRPPVVDLPLCASSGDLSTIPGSIAVVTVRPDGRYHFEGRELDFKRLVGALRTVADRQRARHLPSAPSLVHGILRCPRDMTCGQVFRALEAFEDHEVRISRFHFGVRTAGGREGTLALFRAQDPGLVKTRLGTPHPSNLTHARITLHRDGGGGVARIAGALMNLPEGWTGRTVWLGIGASVSIQSVVSVLDALTRLGARQVRLEKIEDQPGVATLNDEELPEVEVGVLARLPAALAADGPVGLIVHCEWPDGYPPRVVPVGR